MTRRFRAVAAVLAVGAALLGLTAPPAAAENHDLVVTFSEPGDGGTIDTSTVTVAGTVKGRPGLLDVTVERITVTLIREGGGGPADPVVLDRTADFSARFTPPRNGRYTARVAATGKAKVPVVGVDVTPVSGSGERPFGLAAPPRPPQDVKVEVRPPFVTVSWNRNTEPDMLHYEVSRKGPGSDAFVRVGRDVPQPSGPRVTFVDPDVAATGGDYAYRVQAVRRGAETGSTVKSGPSPEHSVTVAAGAVGGPGATGAPAGAPPDIAAFLANQQRPSAPTPSARPRELPDTGFSESLPFGARPPGEEIIEEGEQEPRSLEVGTTTTEFVSRGRPLVPVAAGAILLLLAVHLRLLNSRMKSAPATVGGHAHTDLAPLDLGPADLGPPDRVPRHPPVAEAPAVETFPAPPPRSWLYDYEQMAPPADDDRWAEREWDDDGVREVDHDLREVMVSRAR